MVREDLKPKKRAFKLSNVINQQSLKADRRVVHPDA